MGVFQFSKRRAAKLDVNPRPKDKPVKVSNGEPPLDQMFVKGQKAGSAPEWRVAKALDKLGVDYIYQYSVDGGRTAGGQVIDFFAYTVPLPTPIYVQGEYWHRLANSFADAIKQVRARDVFGASANMPVLVWEKDLGSVDEAYSKLKQVLGGW